MATRAHLPQPRRLPPILARTSARRHLLLASGLWLLASLAVILLAGRTLPFDRPLVAGVSSASELLNAQATLAYALVLMVVTSFVTRRRPILDLAARAPAHSIALAETGFLLVYGVVGQLGGVALGEAIGNHPISFHLPGTIYGLEHPVSRVYALVWAIYNFAVYAVVPLALFRRRGYTTAQLNLRSLNRRNDALLILVILLVDGAFQLLFLGGDFFALDARQLLIGAPISFVLNLFGTVFPTMIFIYAILLPRYRKLSGSFVTTVLLGGLTYAALHLFEAWAVYDTPRHVALSLIFVLFQYVPPGMVKPVLTLRTGNAWVHAVGYHAIFPHTTLDAANTAHVFHVH